MPPGLTVASDRTDAALTGVVELICPPGCTNCRTRDAARRAGTRRISRGRTSPWRCPPAPTLVLSGRAQLTLTGDADLPPPWRQTVEDVRLITVGDPPVRCCGWSPAPRTSTCAPASAAGSLIEIGTDCRADLALEAHLISPWAPGSGSGRLRWAPCSRRPGRFGWTRRDPAGIGRTRRMVALVRRPPPANCSTHRPCG